MDAPTPDSPPKTLQNPPRLRTLDLFSGIGGFSLGLESCEIFQTVAFCEIEPFCRRVLRRHWPGVPIYRDVRRVTHEQLAADGVIPVDVIVGGFPCQDISDAGKRRGLAGERSGLWSEIRRLVGELGPSYVVVENVAALLHRGLDAVLGDLAAVGYDAEWHCIPAAALGAPHRRDRVWIVAYPCSAGRSCRRTARVMAQPCGANRFQASSAAHGRGLLADADGIGCPDTPERYGALPILGRNGSPTGTAWPAEPGVGRVAHGVPDQVDRLTALGNAVVPAVVAWIGQQIAYHHLESWSAGR